MPASHVLLLVLAFAFILTAGPPLGRRFLAWLRSRGVSQPHLDALARIGRIAFAVVKRLEASFVAERKDPATPSVWDDAAKREVKAIAVREVTELAKAVLATLVADGASPARIETIVSDAIEDGVRAQKSVVLP